MSPAEPTAQPRASFAILGPLRVVLDGVEVQIATRRQRALLVLLLMNVGRVVPAERLIDQLWDGTPPPQAAVTLRSYVSNLRQALGGKEGLGGALTTRAQGYCLDVPRDTVDAVNLGLLADRGRELLRAGQVEAAVEAFDRAVGSWSGQPLAEVADHEAAQSTLTQLTETYLGAVEGRFEALLGAGRHADALPELERFAADHPLREEPQALLMLALYRSGRAPEALEVHRRFRTLLQEELGIDPSARLDQLHQQVLAQDRDLDAPIDPARTPPREQPGTTPTPSRASRPGPPFVGRIREREVLGAHLDALRTGAGALVLVGGEPGIGKTTLLETLDAAAREHGIPVHAGRAPAAAGAPAFWPWSQVLDSLAGTLDDDALARAVAGAARPVAQLSPAIAERIGQQPPLTGDNPQSMRFLLYEAVSSFIRQVRGDDPLVISLDDLHWADRPSLELLSYLTPTLSGRPLLITAAYRDLPADRSEALADTLATVSREDTAHELTLSGLAADDVATLTHDLLGTKHADARTRDTFSAMLHNRTGGNPFFIRQLARLMLESQTPTTSLAPPPGVRHVIVSRLKPLSERTRDLLAAAAVAGREFDLRLAAAGAGVDIADALDAYDDAARHGLLEPASTSGTRRFVHALVQEVVLEELPAGRAARLHAAVAAQLQRDGTAAPGALAEHTWAARELLGAEAVDAQLAAADAWAAAFAPEQAEVYLRRALELSRNADGPSAEGELNVLLRLIRLLTSMRGWGDPEVRGLVDRTMRLTDAGVLDDITARLWWSIWFFLLDRDDPSFTDLVTSLDTALAGQEDTEHLGEAGRAAVELAGVLAACRRDDRQTAKSRLRQARVHVEAATGEALAAYDEHLHVMLLIIEGTWAALHHDAEGHRAATEAAVALADADGRPFPRTVARTLAATNAVYLDDPAAHAALARDALELSERFGFGWLATIAGSLVAWAEARQARSPESAATSIERVLQETAETGHRGTLPVLNLMLADVRRVQGATEQAREALLAARAQPGPYGGLIVDVVDRKLAALR